MLWVVALRATLSLNYMYFVLYNTAFGTDVAVQQLNTVLSFNMGLKGNYSTLTFLFCLFVCLFVCLFCFQVFVSFALAVITHY